MHKTRALLDSLMGPSRDKMAKDRCGEDFFDKSICKSYLIGFCPHAVLGGKIEGWTRCAKIHSEAMVEEFRKHAECERYQKEYEESVIRLLSDLVSEADSRGSKEKKKKRPKETVVRIPDHLKVKMQNYEETKQNLLRIAKEKGQSGDGKGKEDAEHEADRAQVQIDSIRRSHTQEFPGEEVCEACGVRYLLDQIGEADDHFATESHKAYAKAREKLAEFRKKESQKKNKGESKDKDEKREKDKHKKKKEQKKKGSGSGTGSDRSRDRNRHDRKERADTKEKHDRDRDRDRSRKKEDKDRRSRSRERKSRSRDKDRSRRKRDRS